MSLNSKIVEILKKHPEGGEKFFNALDFMIRGDVSIGHSYIEWLCSYYTPSEAGAIGIVVTGRFGHFLISNYGRKLLQYFGDVVIVNGGIRDGEEPEIFRDNLLMANYIFLDDSYYSGTTRDRIQKAMKSITPTATFSRTFVVYDGSRRMDFRVKSMYRYYE